MADKADRYVVQGDETLLIRTQMPRGDIYTLEMRQVARTFAEVQQLIDTVTDERQTVLSVWRIETVGAGIPVLVEDITGEFDVRSAEQIHEDAKRAEMAICSPAYTQRSHGTYHVSGGRVA
ncbi:hypothetical protein [Shinella zoogloeoides]|uniref:hypothetical protein n=1 Tax=Shinella zoogloeoides TaxID=352475 RepID=UPI00299E72A5|nr:hypothetical protein [Shinella zoogloeoides]WPE22452.1 hypothetical protein ShzoTeo12_36680 [Shinella zoogloeoides]